MAGRKNFQTCAIQEVRPDEIYQISWLEGEHMDRAFVHLVFTFDLFPQGTQSCSLAFLPFDPA
jgi:hypothetical protein